mgnify:CR=1 FL=1
MNDEDITRKAIQFGNEARELGLSPEDKAHVFESYIDGTFDSVKDAVDAMKSGELPGQPGELLKENTKRSLAGEQPLPQPERNPAQSLKEALKKALGMENKVIEVTLPNKDGNF